MSAFRWSSTIRLNLPWKKVKTSYLSLIVGLVLVGLLLRLAGFSLSNVLTFTQQHPVIVWWTPFTPFERIVRPCSKGTCVVVKNRREILNPLTEAVLFYGTDFRWTDLPLPRDSKHYWSLLHEESPKNNWGFAHTPGISVFNFTSTFSRYSDYPLVLQHLESIDALLKPLKYTTAEKSSGNRSGLVMYIQSDCGTPSDRDAYVTELMKHVKVDSYGRCLHNKDLPKNLVNPIMGMNSPELLDIIARYKFILAFENAVCQDYVTEKFWRSFEAGSVPIYKGSPSISDWAPSNCSVIVADDFNSPKELGEYLKLLNTNDQEYEKYLSYKKLGVTNKRLLKFMEERDYYLQVRGKPDMVDGFECAVCDKIHERKENSGRVEPQVANHGHFNCQYPKPSIKRHRSKSWFKDQIVMWRQIASLEFYHSKAVADVISKGGDLNDVKLAYENAGKQLTSDDFRLKAEDFVTVTNDT